MSEEKKAPTPVVPSATLVFNVMLAEDTFKIVEDELATYVGKVGYNPFLWAEKNVRPLKDMFIKGDRTIELYNKIMALPTKPDPHTKDAAFQPGLTSVVFSNLQK